MWTKPKKWGGYDTANAKFYLQGKDKTKIIFEDAPEWKEKYSEWENGGKEFFIFGMIENK
jgi:hypothetical protein